MMAPRSVLPLLVVADRHGLRAAKKVKSVGVGGGDLPKPAAALYLHGEKKRRRRWGGAC